MQARSANRSRSASRETPDRGLRSVCAAALALGLAAAACAAQPRLLAVRVNSVDMGEQMVDWGEDGPAIAPALLRAWHLHTAAQGADGAPVPLARLPGARFTLDEASQSLDLQLAPQAFEPTRLQGLALAVPSSPVPSMPGVRLDYDLLAQHGAGRTSAGAMLDGGAFGAWGTLRSAVALQPRDGGGTRLARLETAFVHDWFEDAQTLRLGDAVSDGGSWGRAWRFGGVQWNSDAAMRPAVPAYALPSVHGQASVPSTVDVYVDNIRRLHAEVPAGPFELNNVPVLTGRGDMQVVVRDALGRDQLLSLPYLASPQLLRAGASEFSASAGLLRRGYLGADDRYAGALLAGTWRHGVSDSLSRELHLEATPWGGVLGAAAATRADALWPGAAAAVLSAGTAGGVSGAGRGAMVQAGVQVAGADTSLSVQAQMASPRFEDPAAGAFPRRSLAASVAGTWHGAFISLAAAARRDSEGERQQALSLHVTLGAGPASQWSVYAAQDMVHHTASVGLLWSRALDTSTGIFASTGRDQGRTQNSVEVRRDPAAGQGWGYRVQGQDVGEDAHGLLGVSWNGPTTAFVAEAAQDRVAGAAQRLQTRGAWVLAGGALHAAPSLNGSSFALVETGGAAGTRVLRDNQEVARTDGQGRAFVPGLRPWEENELRIEPADLALDARVDSTLRTVVPARGGGVLVRFDVQTRRSATAHLADGFGAQLPVGTPVLQEDGTPAGRVALDGLLYIEQYVPGTRLEVRGDVACSVRLPAADVTEPLPELGLLRCVTRGYGP